MTMEIAVLSAVVLVTALIAGAIRGFVGYYINAPEDEKFSVKKIGKTMVRYAVFNLATVYLLAAGGVVWTVVTVIGYTVILLAPEIGFDIQKNRAT